MPSNEEWYNDEAEAKRAKLKGRIMATSEEWRRRVNHEATALRDKDDQSEDLVNIVPRKGESASTLRAPGH